MTRIFHEKNISKINSDDLGEYRIELNTSESSNTLDVAVFVPKQEFFSNGKIDAVVNEGETGKPGISFSTPLEKILKTTGNEAIYQASLPLDKFALKDNIISLKSTIGSNVNRVFTTITGFVEDMAPQVMEVTMQRTSFDKTTDIVFWNAILSTNIKFSDYRKFIDYILCNDIPTTPTAINTTRDVFDRRFAKIRSPFVQSEEYNLIKFATEFFMLLRFGIPRDQLSSYLSNDRLPYFDLIIQALDNDTQFSFFSRDKEDDCTIRERQRFQNPFLVELIWNYWMEQGMLVQTMNAISLRFQNLHTGPYIKPLERFDTDPLRPLSHILWGYIQDEQHRLSIKRRAYEYDHEYGLNLIGKAVPQFSGVDTRVKFLEVFHDLLTSCALFFKEADDTTRIADAFPVLNNLREVHLLLAAGNHNAYGNLTWTARHEMLVQQYILARKEMREFLGGRPMLSYNEEWMDRVDSMRLLQGWGTASIINYYELAVCGEQILLSIRYGNWNDVNLGSSNAANWAKAFRDRIQRYIHAYRVVTGVDLSDEVIDTRSKTQRYIQPSLLIQQRLLDNGSMSRNLASSKRISSKIQ